uniref:Toll-like receptor 3 n=1 Tax=Brugia pahangi TaxID=6280 RepID=A0A0N4TY72_BRUPA
LPIQDIHNYFNTDNLLPRDDATKEVVWHDRHQLFKRCLCLFGQSVDRSVPMFVILCVLPYAGFQRLGKWCI